MIVANPLRGEAVAQLGDEQLRIVVDVAALIVLEQLTSRSFLEIAAEMLALAEANRPPKLQTMQALVFAGTREAHAELTPGDCASLFLQHARPLIEAVTTALVAALPGGTSPPGEAKPPRKKRASGTGTAPSAAG